jgi:Bacteriophage CI repressor helix-turn-helix domain.
MKYNKIEALLKLKDMNMSDFARFLNVSRQQLNNKKSKDTFRADELIQLAELTNTTLSFVDKDTGETLIEFNINDIKK